MKLWQKISLVCSAVLIVIVAVCGALLLIQSKNSLLSQTYEQISDKQYNLSQSFSEMMNYLGNDESSAAAKQATAKYCFSRFADSSSVLADNSSILYSEIIIDPRAYLTLPLSGEQTQFTGEAIGRNIAITGSGIHIGNMTYSVYVVEDISTVYNDIALMAWKFLAIGVASIALGVALIIILVRKTMRPLEQLRESIIHIASGEYKERAALTSHDEIGELAEDYNAMADSVEAHIEEITQAAERQYTFLGNVTHEYKTPLTSIILHTKALKNNYMTEEQRENSLAHIERQSVWLERLTQKLLRLITSDKQLDRKNASVRELFDRAAESTDELLYERGTSLIADCYISTLYIDTDLMQSALVNLIDNASKASQPGGHIYLAAHDNAIVVKDEGCGIPPEELSRITEPFYMVDRSRSKRQNGCGLGLTLVKKIVSLHNAELLIESAPGTGTTVSIIFPVTQ